MRFVRVRHILVLPAAATLALALGGCAPRHMATNVAATESNADQYLFERGNESLQRHHWIEAREYYRKLIDTYPTSRYRQDAKLAVGDSFLGERRSETDVQAGGEFKEFLRFYPAAARADYAQYKLVVSLKSQMLGPERDQTPTHDALREIDTFLANYPASKILPDVLKLQREVRDQLSESEYLVGRHYYRSRWYPGAVSRLTELLKTDPQYSGRDGAYFFLAEAYRKQKKPADALTYYEKIVEEFKVSNFLKDAKSRITELSTNPPTPPTTQQVADVKK